jgi:primary-amine oxidase
LADGGAGASHPVVEKYTRAIINHGSHNVIRDYLVGPLPLSARTTIRQLTEIYSAPVPLNARTTFNFPVLAQLVGRLMTPIDDITRDLFNVSVLDRSLTISAQMPLSYDGGWRRTWVQLKRNVPGSWIHPIDFYYLVSLRARRDFLFFPVAHGSLP